MKNTHVVKKRPGSPAKESQASTVQKLDPKSNTILKRSSSENTSQIIIKGETVALKRRRMRTSETIDVLDPKAVDLLKEFEEVA